MKIPSTNRGPGLDRQENLVSSISKKAESDLVNM